MKEGSDDVRLTGICPKLEEEEPLEMTIISRLEGMGLVLPKPGVEKDGRPVDGDAVHEC